MAKKTSVGGHVERGRDHIHLARGLPSVPRREPDEVVSEDQGRQLQVSRRVLE